MQSAKREIRTKEVPVYMFITILQYISRLAYVLSTLCIKHIKTNIRRYENITLKIVQQF